MIVTCRFVLEGGFQHSFNVDIHVDPVQLKKKVEEERHTLTKAGGC